MFNVVINVLSDRFKMRFFTENVFTHEPPYNRRYDKRMIETPFTDDDGNPYFATPHLEPEDIKRLRALSVSASVSRTSNRICKIAMSSERWKYFCTFTFDPSVVDRYSFEDVSFLLKKFLKNFRRRRPDAQYLVVPEKHKDGAWHFHGIFSDDLQVDYAGKFKKIHNGRFCGESRYESYHVKDWTYGFSNASIIRDHDAVCRYISKYITKDLCESTKFKRRYWYSYSTIDIIDDERFLMSMEQLKAFLEVASSHLINGGLQYAKDMPWEYIDFYFEIDAFDDIMEYVSGYDDGVFYSMSDDC